MSNEEFFKHFKLIETMGISFKLAETNIRKLLVMRNKSQLCYYVSPWNRNWNNGIGQHSISTLIHVYICCCMTFKNICWRLAYFYLKWKQDFYQQKLKESFFKGVSFLVSSCKVKLNFLAPQESSFTQSHSIWYAASCNSCEQISSQKIRLVLDTLDSILRSFSKPFSSYTGPF